jgi:HEPN domain-containing protein
MKPITREWVEKAEGDYHSAGRELRARRNPNYDAACFHAQQCAEKYLTARLQETKVTFEKTHNLIELLEIVLKAEPSWELLRPFLQALNIFSVGFRYPGESATKEMAKKAVADCRKVRETVRHNLKLKS